MYASQLDMCSESLQITKPENTDNKLHYFIIVMNKTCVMLYYRTISN